MNGVGTEVGIGVCLPTKTEVVCTNLIDDGFGVKGGMLIAVAPTVLLIGMSIGSVAFGKVRKTKSPSTVHNPLFPWSKKGITGVHPIVGSITRVKETKSLEVTSEVCEVHVIDYGFEMDVVNREYFEGRKRDVGLADSGLVSNLEGIVVGEFWTVIGGEFRFPKHVAVEEWGYRVSEEKPQTHEDKSEIPYSPISPEAALVAPLSLDHLSRLPGLLHLQPVNKETK